MPNLGKKEKLGKKDKKLFRPTFNSPELLVSNDIAMGYYEQHIFNFIFLK